MTGRVLVGILVAGVALSACNAETNEDVTLLEQSLAKGSGGVNGEGDYCNNAVRCVAGEGDCDNNFQCTAGLVCGVDNGLNFNQVKANDICVAPHCANSEQDVDEAGVDCGGADCGTCFVCPANDQNGGASFCTNDCPCDSGQGDCDSNFQCAQGLACIDDIGDQFGIQTMYDVCAPAHCGNGGQDGDEAGIDCGGADCGNCPGCPLDGANGGAAFCTVDCPCDDRQGDCDLDIECATGLVCADDVGLNYSMNRTYDVCLSSTCAANPMGSNSFCSVGCRCAAGVGDCDLNTHCNPGLVCGVNNADQFRDNIGRGVNQYETCVLAQCVNGTQDGGLGETGIDCGGPCGECLAAHCSDGIRNIPFGESGIDCGGPDCGRCLF